MKRIIILFVSAVLCFAVMLCSCSAKKDGAASRSTDASTDGAVRESAVSHVTESDVSESDAPEPDIIGIYDDLEDNGTYTRLTRWDKAQVPGEDIAVFDILPSLENTITGQDYSTVWNNCRLALGITKVDVHLYLEYTTADGGNHAETIDSPNSAESVSQGGYIEIYLYDDIHQPDGAWYSHLTEDDVNDDTVISSVKITAGEHIDEVTSIKLTAYLTSPELGSTVVLSKNV